MRQLFQVYQSMAYVGAICFKSGAIYDPAYGHIPTKEQLFHSILQCLSCTKPWRLTFCNMDFFIHLFLNKRKDYRNEFADYTTI